jgi:two-component system CheB/CheR fusion protein
MTDTISADVKKKPNRKNFPIVAVGASAGGIQAVNELLGNLSPNTGMAFIYIIHLDPEHESNIAAVLGRNTEMKVTEASHLVTIEPNNVYVIPANKEMTIVEGVLALSPRPEKRSMHNPIDLFFSSLAEKHREGTIGILLSGCGSDGAMGLKTIKLAGGFTFAQNETAQFQSMPKSAISEGIVDMVLSPAQIAQELERLSRKISVLLDVAEDSGNETDKDEALTEILHLVKKTIGVDFSHYKTTTIRRRILRRMVLAQLDDKPEYLTFLKKNTQEVSLLYQDLLINVTSFFRDPDALEYLKKAILPRIIKARAPSDPIRVWVPACSTGEEAYTLAMLFLEELGDKAGSIPLQIFATDLSELVISKARLGIYCTNDVANVSDQRLEKFFTKIDGSYRINKVVRDLCVFAPHNVSKDPPFSRMDLISCCNLMIYLDTVLQKKILNIFHYALNPEGYLV